MATEHQNTPQKKDRKPPKKRPRNLSPASQQRYELENLLAHPEKELVLPLKRDNDSELLPPDILLNIQGSSAGAGSGEFHVYKASRKRELERIRKFEEEIEKEESEKQFLREREERERLLAEKTAKNRKRREKKKMKERGKENGEKKEGNRESVGKVGLKVNVPVKGAAMFDDGIDTVDEREAPEGLMIIEGD